MPSSVGSTASGSRQGSGRGQVSDTWHHRDEEKGPGMNWKHSEFHVKIRGWDGEKTRKKGVSTREGAVGPPQRGLQDLGFGGGGVCLSFPSATPGHRPLLKLCPREAEAGWRSPPLWTPFLGWHGILAEQTRPPWSWGVVSEDGILPPDWMGPGDKLASEGRGLHQPLPTEARGSQSLGTNSYDPSPSESHHVRGQGRDAVSHVAGAGAHLAVRCLRSFPGQVPPFPS